MYLINETVNFEPDHTGILNAWAMTTSEAMAFLELWFS